MSSAFDSSDDDEDLTKTAEEVSSPPLQLDWIDLSDLGLEPPSPVVVAISSLPGARFKDQRRDLQRDLETLKSQEVTDVVCLLTKHELRQFRVGNLLEKYEENGLVCHHFPVEDGLAPEVDQMDAVIARMRGIFEKDDGMRRKVLVHCFGGLGRAGVVAACLLISLGRDLSAEAAIERVRALRGPRAVQSVKQYNFIFEYWSRKMEREKSYKNGGGDSA